VLGRVLVMLIIQQAHVEAVHKHLDIGMYLSVPQRHHPWFIFLTPIVNTTHKEVMVHAMMEFHFNMLGSYVMKMVQINAWESCGIHVKGKLVTLQ